MKTAHNTLLPVVPLALLLSACSGHPLTPGSTDVVQIESEPADSEVWVMGKTWGRTPVEIPLKAVFPITYPPEQQALYGRIRFAKAGCDDLTLPLSTSAVGRGKLVGRLKCGPASSNPARAAVVTRVVSPAGAASSSETPGAQTSAQSPAAESPSARIRLLRLNELRDEGLITDDEYQQLRKRILDSL